MTNMGEASHTSAIPRGTGISSRFLPRLIHVGLARCALVWAFLGLFFLPCRLFGAANSEGPSIVSGAKWEFTSFLQASGLSRRYVFCVAFEKNSTAWVAASDGLYRYDGYSWRRYGMGNGLPSEFVRSVCVDSQGRLWVGTDCGAGVFDGKSFDRMGSDKGLAGPSVRRISQDSDGSLWFCCDRWPDNSLRGGLSCLREGVWTTYRENDGLPCDYVFGYFRERGGDQYVFTRNGCRRKSGERWVVPNEPGFPSSAYSTAMVMSGAGDLFVERGLNEPPLMRKAGLWQTARSDGCGPFCSTREGDVYLVIHRGESRELCLTRWTGDRFHQVSPVRANPHGSAEVLAEAPDGSIWAVGPEVILRWQPSGGEWTPYGGLPPAQLLDNQNRVWFADNSNTYRRTESGFERVAGGLGTLARGADGDVWSWSGSRITQWRASGNVTYDSAQTGLEQVRTFIPDGQGHSWFHGLDADGKTALAVQTPTGWLRPVVPELAEKQIFRAGTDARSGVWLLVREDNLPPRQVVHVTLDRTTWHNLPAATVNYGDGRLLTGRQGVWVYGSSGLHQLVDPESGSWKRVSGLVGDNVFGAMSSAGRSCFLLDGRSGGGSGYAIFEEGRLEQASAQLGWYWACASDGTFYIQQGSGFIVIPPKPNDHRFYLPLPEDIAVVSLVKGPGRDLWVSTPTGVLHYHPNLEPPKTIISESDGMIREGTRLRLRVRGVKRWVSDHPQAAFLFSWRFDGGEWTEFQAALPADLPTAGFSTGAHRLAVRCQLEGREIDPSPAEVAFVITPIPLQERVWFSPVAGGLFLLLLALAGSALLARHKLALSAGRLEEMVKNRTTQLTRSNESLKRENAERKQAEQALRQSETRYRTLVHTQSDGLIVLDGQLRCLFANPAAESLCGVASGQLSGRELAAFLAPGQLETVQRRSQGLSPGEARECEIELVRADGNKRSVLLTVTQQFDGASKEHGLLAIFHDVTGRKHLEDQLRQAQKMEVVGQLAGGVAHDFNNILTSILMNLSLLRDEPNLTHGIKASLQEIEVEANRAANLTRQLLLFGRRQVIQKGPVCLDDLVGNLLKMLRRILGEDVALEFGGQTNLPLIDADPGMMEQVVMNLSVNARDAMPKGGRLTISTGVVEIDAEAAQKNREARPGRFVCLTVTDVGCGMDEATLKRIFEPFFTTKDVGKGTGLGLATVFGIVKQHQGWIEVDSAIGKGTQFRIFFPVAETHLQAPKVSASDRVTRRGSETILLVEDEPAVRFLARRCLQRDGYRVLEATNGVEALALWREHRQDIGLLFTDMVMPEGMTGLELAEQLMSEKAGVKVILCSGYNLEMARDGASVSKNIAYLPKPYEPTVLSAAVRKCLDGK